MWTLQQYGLSTPPFTKHRSCIRPKDKAIMDDPYKKCKRACEDLKKVLDGAEKHLRENGHGSE